MSASATPTRPEVAVSISAAAGAEADSASKPNQSTSTSSSAPTAHAQANKKSPSAPAVAAGAGAAFSCRRWLALPLFFGALLLSLFAAFSAVTHTYRHPLSLLSRTFGTPLFGHLEYDADQTCEMSYFSLAHREVRLEGLSPISQALVDGEIAFGRERPSANDQAAATATATAGAGTKKQLADMDEEDAELAAAEEAELAASRTAAASKDPMIASAATNASSILQQDFDAFAALFLSALPRHLAERKASEPAAPSSSTAGARYRLMQYPHPQNDVDDSPATKQEQQRRRRASAQRVPVLFVHGNGGSYHQMRSLASRLKSVYDGEGSPSTQRNDFFSVDFHEENSAFSGKLLWRQAWFVNEAMHHILQAYSPTTQVVLVCHSMGAVVCRSLFALGNLPRTPTGGARVAMIGMLGGPQRAPVLWTDGWMKRMYQTINQPEKAEAQPAADETETAVAAMAALTSSTDLSTIPSGGLAHLFPLVHLGASARTFSTAAAPSSNTTSPGRRPFLLSLGGGERDFQIEPARTDLAGLYADSQQLSLTAHTLGYASLAESGGIGAAVGPGGLGSVDHQCLAWCKQIIETLAYSVREVTRNVLADQLHLPRVGEGEMMQRQRALWLPASLLAWRQLATAAGGSQAPSSEVEGVDGKAPARVFMITDEDWRQAKGPTFSGTLSPRGGAHGGVLIVWTGWMEQVEMCATSATAAVGDSSATCADVTSRAHLLHPQLHPEHKQLSDVARASKRIGVASTYMLFLADADLTALGLPAHQPIRIRFTPSEAARAILSKLRPLRGKRHRVMVHARVVSLKDQPDDGGALRFGSPTEVIRWQQHIPAGVDLHMDVHVSPAGHGELLEADDMPLPQYITLFTPTSGDSPVDANRTATAWSLPASTFADQLHVFYPSSVAQRRSVHIYRSSTPRTVLGLIVRVQTTAGDQTNSLAPVDAADDASRVTIHAHSFLSFLHTLYLQFSILPQLILGTALILFGIQYEYLRKYGRFPRVYQLLELPSKGDGWRGWTASSLVWSIALVAACFQLFFHGSLPSEPAVGASSDAPASMLSGWHLQRGRGWELGWAGFLLFLACVALHVALEALVYGLLAIGSRVGGLIRCGSDRSVAAPSAAALAPQQRYLSSLGRRATLVAWVGSFVLSLVFTLALWLYDLKFFLGMGLLDALHFVGREVTAWLSTAGMIFGLISEHFFFSDLLAFLEQYAVMAARLNVLVVAGGLIGFAIVMQMATFPDTRSSTLATLSEGKQTAARSSAAYKASGVTMILLLSTLLLFPAVLASLRLDVTSLADAWEVASRSANGSPLLFQPPSTKTTWDAAGTSSVPPVVADGLAGTLLLYPFTISAWSVDPLSLIVLTWVTMFSWCLFHIPFSPPILQSCCLTTYGLGLLFLTGPTVAYFNLYWMAALLCLCVLPHTMASQMYCVNLILDRVEGREGTYDQRFDDEVKKHQQQQQQQQQPQTKVEDGKKQTPAAAPRDAKKHR